MATFTESIVLDDKVSGAAKAAAAATAELGAGLAAAQKNMIKFAALGDQKNYDKSLKSSMTYTAALAKLPPVQATATIATKKLGESTFDAAQAITVGKETIGAAMDGIHAAFASLAQGDVKGAIEGLTDGVAGVAKALDLVVPGLGEAVSAVIKIAGGAVGITAGLIQSGMEFAIQANQSKAAMVGMFDALGAGKVTGVEVNEMLENLASQTGLAKEKFAPMTQAFMKMGVTGVEQLKALTVAAASANVVAGEGGAQAFETLTKKVQIAAQTGGKLKLDPKFIKGLAEAGLTIDDVAKGLGTTGEKLKGSTVDAAKLGDVITKAVTDKGAKGLDLLSSSIGAVKENFMANIGKMFEDVDVGPFMKAVKDLFSIFDSKASPSGQAMKAGIGGFFKEAFADATKLVPIVEGFLLDIVIYGLQAYIALVPIVAKVKELWASAEKSGILTAVFDGLVTALVTVGYVLAVVVGFFVGMVALSALVGVGIIALGGYFGDLTATIVDALGGWAGTALSAASDFIQGLIQGISSGASMVADAAKGVASGAVNAVENFLGIQSPSTVMAEIGGHAATGMAQGLEGGMGDVHGASSGLATATVAGASGGGNAGASTGSSIQVTNYFTIEGAGQTAQELTDVMVSMTFESIALAQGI